MWNWECRDQGFLDDMMLIIQTVITYNITGWRSTGAELHGAFEEHVVAIVELEDVEVYVVTIDQWNAGFYIVKVATEYITVLTTTESQIKKKMLQFICLEVEMRKTLAFKAISI